jgi:hypothetical protein
MIYMLFQNNIIFLGKCLIEELTLFNRKIESGAMPLLDHEERVLNFIEI